MDLYLLFYKHDKFKFSNTVLNLTLYIVYTSKIGMYFSNFKAQFRFDIDLVDCTLFGGRVDGDEVTSPSHTVALCRQPGVVGWHELQTLVADSEQHAVLRCCVVVILLGATVIS